MTEAAAEIPPPGRRSPRPGQASIGTAMVLGGAALFSVNGTVSKVVLTEVDSLSLVLLRSAGTAVVLFLAVLVVEPARLRITRAELPLMVGYGIAGIALVQWLYFVAIARLPVGVALLFEFTAPVMVALWARFVQHKPASGRLWAALALSLGGLAIVAQVWDGMTLDVVGVLAGLGAAVSLASYYLVGEHMVTSRDTLSLTFWGFVFAALFWAVVHPPWTVPWSEVTSTVSLQGTLESWRVPVWTLVAWIVVLGTAVPFALEIGALRRISATLSGIVGTSEPVLSGAVAWVWLGETLAAVQVVGALVVLAGIALAQTARGGESGSSPG